jgi:hypothetical protein
MGWASEMLQLPDDMEAKLRPLLRRICKRILVFDTKLNSRAYREDLLRSKRKDVPSMVSLDGEQRDHLGSCTRFLPQSLRLALSFKLLPAPSSSPFMHDVSASEVLCKLDAFFKDGDHSDGSNENRDDICFLQDKVADLEVQVRCCLVAQKLIS